MQQSIWSLFIEKRLSENPETRKPNIQYNHFYIKNGNKFDKIYINQVLYIEAMENYVLIETKEKVQHIHYISELKHPYRKIYLSKYTNHFLLPWMQLKV